MAGRAGTNGNGLMTGVPQVVAAVVAVAKAAALERRRLAKVAALERQRVAKVAALELERVAKVAALELERRRVAKVALERCPKVAQLATVELERCPKVAQLATVERLANRRAPRHHEGFHLTGGSAETAITSPTSGTS